MSQQPSQFSQQPQQTGQQNQRNLGQFARDPATGQFLTRPEQAYVQELARQYPQQVQQAYRQNVPFSAVGIPAPPNLGEPGTQVSPGMGQQGMQSQQQMPQSQGMGQSQQPMGQQGQYQQ